KFHTIAAGHGAEESEGQQQHFGMAQRLGHGHAMAAMEALLALELLLQSVSLLGREPAGMARPVLQHEEDDDTQDDGRKAPENVNALPALKAEELEVMDGDAVDRFDGSD